MSIVERLGDAALMFWQSLDERERRVVVFGLVYAVYLLVQIPLEAKRQENDRRELAAAIAQEIQRG